MSSKYPNEHSFLPNEHSFLTPRHHCHYHSNESTLSPPKIVVTSIMFLHFSWDNVWTSHLGLFLFVLHVFD
jgi:hypothetical protein